VKPSNTRTSSPTRDRGDATRQRILTAAATVLSTKGYAATRLSDIAAEADVRTPGVYYYFASRDELIAEVMRVGQRRVREHVESALASVPDDAGPRERIRVAVEAHLRVELELSEFATAVTRNTSQLTEQVRGAQQAESDRYHRMWRTLLETARSEGLLLPDLDLGIARMLVIGALNWTPEWWRTSTDSIDVLVATAQSIVCAGLFGIPADPGDGGSTFDSMLNS
jgi:AcrR family transcriptional regulator